MGIDDGPADRQPHSHTAGLRCVESFENTLDMLWIDARPGIANHDEDAIRLRFLGADQQLSRPRLDRGHCLDRVQHQVQNDLLQLNAIPPHGRQPLRKARLDQDAILGDCASPQYNHFVDRVIKIKAGHLRRRFPDVIADPIDDLSGSIGIGHDTGKCFPDLAQLGRLPIQEIQGRSSVVARGGDGLGNLVDQRSGLLSNDAQAVHVREIGLQLAQPLMHLLRALTFRHIHVRTDNLDGPFAHEVQARCRQSFDRPIKQRDSELARLIVFLAQRLLNLFPHPVSIVWMDPLPHSFAAWKALLRIKPPNPVTLV
jgi:hypothetical protein